MLEGSHRPPEAGGAGCNCGSESEEEADARSSELEVVEIRALRTCVLYGDRTPLPPQMS